MNLTNLTNEELGQLQARIDNEIATRESDAGFQEAWLAAVPPRGNTSCLDNALYWNWLAYLRLYGAYVGPTEPRDMGAYKRELAARE